MPPQCGLLSGVAVGGVQQGQPESAHILSCSALFLSTALITHQTSGLLCLSYFSFLSQTRS